MSGHQLIVELVIGVVGIKLTGDPDIVHNKVIRGGETFFTPDDGFLYIAVDAVKGIAVLDFGVPLKGGPERLVRIVIIECFLEVPEIGFHRFREEFRQQLLIIGREEKEAGQDGNDAPDGREQYPAQHQRHIKAALHVQHRYQQHRDEEGSHCIPGL